MNITINIEDLSNLTVRSSNGSVYRLVKESVLDDVERRLEELASQSTERLVTQTELLKIKRVGYTRLKKWVAQGLSEIPDGNKVLYDLDELDELLKNKKI